MVDYIDFRREYNNTLKYTRRQFDEAVKQAIESMTVNRVIQHINGNQQNQIALQILAIHKTPDGITVIVR